MRTKLEMKLIGEKEDIEEVLKKILPVLYKYYVVGDFSNYRQNYGESGVHKFISIKPMPISVLAGLGDSGRAE